MTNKEKQNKSLENTLIITANSSTKESQVPKSKTANKTVVVALYEVLKNNPYKFKQYDLFYEVHINILSKNEEDLKLDTYKLQRSELCSLLGWGIHGNKEGEIALIDSQSKLYEELLSDSSIVKKKAYEKK
ncbi:hypothetical protein G1K66_09070 [Tenacibaculum finnmarkense]|uniref:DUF6157 family protein n=1 Tax=Tenacibaculum finnmarkense TaxID=2781243 RepID=UPI001EFBD85E|nr:DUF6157 family protein [Tenacibaculum finnmarkense]MCG8808861.1 hypothetical protein [Tenacibaculum finnmarkense]MCG8813410.1 hypothetical protein [Tenacibaculum finnmarkense]MCG8819097.1 hypothetical protein [Tenacibaculum finnmarkense]MCG8893747.1 hypothetical protein [Tenacibaculum finnmarkense]MCG8901234.1 hypothetical protein [Tenacibaculum finnmarkense]